MPVQTTSLSDTEVGLGDLSNWPFTTICFLSRLEPDMRNFLSSKITDSGAHTVHISFKLAIKLNVNSYAM